MPKKKEVVKNDLLDTTENPLVIESMDAQKLEWNIGYFVELMDNGDVNFETPVQRGYVWNNKKDSLAIRSILRRVPLSNFYYNRVNGIYEGLEGKQRGTAIYEFVKGRYKLHANTPPIKVNGEVYEIARHTFDELPKTLQNRILTYSLDGHWFDNMSLDEKVEFFILTNSGKPVTAAEISRIRIKSRDMFLSLTEHPVLMSVISENNRRKCKDEDIISQLWCMCFSETDSLLQKDIGPILASTEVTSEQKNEIINAFDYLSEYYKAIGSDKSSFAKSKKPTHILSLAYMAFLASSRKMSKDEYVEKASTLFSGAGRTVTISEAYNKAVGAGSAKPEQMRIRISEIENALD